MPPAGMAKPCGCVSTCSGNCACRSTGNCACAPSAVAAELRKIASSMGSPGRPLRSSVAASVLRVLAAVDGTSVVWFSGWSEEDARAASAACGGVAIGASPYGEGHAVEVPSAAVEQCIAKIPGAGSLEERGIHVFDSWEHVGYDEDAFEMLPL